MQKYKISVSKQGKNFTFVLTAEDKIKAKERVHKEWYSILNIEEISDISNFWHKFIFEAEKNWIKKNWKIIWEDIFKAYIKLRKKLWYKVFWLFEEKNKDLNYIEKQKIIKELEEEYNIYILNIVKDNKKEEKKENKKVEKNITDSNYDNENFYLKKNLEETYKLIDFILEKIKNIIDWKEIEQLWDEEKEKLKSIYNWIIKIKTTTNILKLKEIWEKSLIKIWLIELKFLEKNKTKKLKNLLNETNWLLKKIWSNKSIVEKIYSFSYYSWLIKKYFNEKLNSNNKKIIKNNKIDKESYSFIKNQLLLNKYIEKLKLNRKSIIKNFFNKNREKLLLKNKLIKQNITILKAKQKWIWFSYTYLKKRYDNLFLGIMFIFNNIRKSFLYIIILYTIFFIFFINFNLYLNIKYFNYNWIKYIIFILFLYYILFLSKNIYTILINFIIYYLLILFFIVNF